MRIILLILCLILSGCNSVPTRFVCHKEPPEWAICTPKDIEATNGMCISQSFSDYEMILVCEPERKK